ncbi:hypothetical protein BDF14DRAFT_1822357 [Spinellus fusiger]|nr:hypothetical protein BDF14DRAFT_1822357 [Spinellus fusiger]
MRFQGTIETDGVAVSVIKQNFMSRHSSGGSRKALIDEDHIESIEELSQSALAETKDKNSSFSLQIGFGNRNLAATLNFRHGLMSPRENEQKDTPRTKKRSKPSSPSFSFPSDRWSLG